MSGTGWSVVSSKLQLVQTPGKGVAVAESAPFVVHSDIESCDDGEEDELDTNDKL